MNTIRCLLLACVALLPVLAGVTAQEAPSPPRNFASYEELFDDFDKRREVLVSRFERITSQERPSPDEIARVEGEMIALDREYEAALRGYIRANPRASDLMPARFELAVTLSRMEDRLDDAISAADSFLEAHADSELATDIRFVRAQTLFRISGREAHALKALEAFIQAHPERREADAARMMRVRTQLFMDRVGDARLALRALLETEEVRNDEDAREFIRGQLENLTWIGRELPEFSRTDARGKRVRNADFAGKPLLLFVWDSTSNACLGELRYIQEAATRFEGKINVLGISVNESLPAFEQWLGRNQDVVSFNNIWIDRDEENSLVRKLDVSMIPFNVLIDERGRIYRYDVRSDDLLRYAERLAD